MGLKALLNEIDQRKEELDSYRSFDRETWLELEQKVRLWWNYHSNAIEGNRLTLGETRALIMHGLTAKGKPLKDHLDIEGHDEAVKYLEEIVQQDNHISEKFIKDLHQIILQEPYYVDATTPEGQPTRKKVAIGQYKSQNNSVRTQTGELKSYESPEATPGRMSDLIDWYRKEEEEETLHPVLLAANFHYEFVDIHPFDDGNGRLARLLMNLILMKHGYPPAILRIEERQDQYLVALEEADTGELEPFNTYIAEKVKESLDIYLKAAKGEKIEEEDDLDKRVAIIEQKLANEEEVEEVKTPNNLVALIENDLEPLLEDIYSKIGKAQRLFQEYLTGLKIGKDYWELDNPHVALLTVKQEILNNEDFNSFKILFLLRGFKKKGVNTFNCSVAINFYFDEFKYRIHPFDFTIDEYDKPQSFGLSQKPKSLEKLYHQSISKEEKAFLRDEMSNKILYDIEQKAK